MVTEQLAAKDAGFIPPHVPDHLVKDIDFRYAPEIAQDPWTYFASATEGEPIFWTPRNGGHWIVSGTEIVEEVFRKHELFSNGVVMIPPPPRPQSIPSSLDPPEHGKYRKIMSQRMFSPSALRSIEEHMDGVIEELCGKMLPGGECEFIDAFARPLPVALVLKLMGLPPARQQDFCEWSRMMFHGQSVEEHLDGYKQAFGFLGDWVAEERAKAQAGASDDIGPFLSALVEGRVDDRPLTLDECHSLSMLLLGAGVDTVTSQMSHAMQHMALYPQDAQRLISHPELIPKAIEELMRRYGIANITRVAGKDMEYRGVSMKKGDLVLCATAMGGLDDSVFDSAMTVDFDRQPSKTRHTPFGAGPHICPGAYLARTILRTALERLLPAMPNLRIAAGEELSYVSGITISLTRLPLQWDVPAAE